MLQKPLLLLCALTLLVSLSLTAALRYAAERGRERVPMLECPRDVDLGEQHRGTIAVGEFQIANRGSGLLRVEDFQTSCSCAGVERTVDGKAFRVSALEVAPGDAIPLIIRVGVGARIGASQLVQVLFRTNDPHHPQWRVDALIPRVTGGCYAVPSSVLFGSLSPDQESAQTVDLYDNGMHHLAISAVRSSAPGRFRARLLPLSARDREKVHETAGKLFGRIEVKANTPRPGSLEGQVQILFKNDAHTPESIPVVGKVVGPIECLPSAVVLPRRARKELLYHQRILLQHSGKGPVEVTLDSSSLPPGIHADLQAVTADSDQHILSVRWCPQERVGRWPLGRQQLNLHVVSEGRQTQQAIPLFLLSEDLR